MRIPLPEKRWHIYHNKYIVLFVILTVKSKMQPGYTRLPRVEDARRPVEVGVVRRQVAGEPVRPRGRLAPDPLCDVPAHTEVGGQALAGDLLEFVAHCVRQTYRLPFKDGAVVAAPRLRSPISTS